MPTPLPPSTDFTTAADQAAVKTFMTAVRTYLSDLLGTTGVVADARAALGARGLADDVPLAAGKVVIFEGATDDGFETTLSAVDPTGDRAIALPDAAGTLALEAVNNAAAAPATGDLISFSDISDGNKPKQTDIAALLALAGSSGAPTGSVFDYVGAAAPSGYVLLSGRTIGDASSSGTERANADTSALFTLLWDSLADTEAPVSSGRGANAAADFAAHKTITLPDARGRVIAGKDNMGGSTASRLTSGGAGITGTTLGVAGGTQTHTLTTAQLASHSHGAGSFVVGYGLSGSGLPTGMTDTSGNTNNNPVTGTSGSAGSDSAHQNTQPTLVLNKIIKL